MTNREAYLDDLDELLKEIDQLLSAVPIGKTKLEHQAREQAEDVAGRARATINCMKRDYINKSIREQETEIDEIITRFTGKVYRGVRWVKPEEEEHKTVTYREFWAALNELREKFREHHISLDDYTDDETGVISLKVGWASIGSVLAGEAREFADWMRMAASAVENFKYNGYRVKWGE